MQQFIIYIQSEAAELQPNKNMNKEPTNIGRPTSEKIHECAFYPRLRYINVLYDDGSFIYQGKSSQSGTVLEHNGAI